MSTSTTPRTQSPERQIFTRYADQAPVGDVIPFFDDGTYHLFCLTPPEGTLHFPERLRTTWRHLRSTDLVSWEQLPDAVGPGADGEPDRDGAWTGSVIRAADGLHIFYTGHNLAGGIPQTVCHATSPDGITWVKDPRNPISVPDTGRFEGKDWRDPFVFWNEAEQRYLMLLSTRSAGHPAVSRGVVAVQTSPDLVSWSEAQELYETFLTHCPECPEIFRLGDQWILGYSRFTDRRGTVYRTAADPRGPWHHLSTEGPDGTNWYAAKSLTDDRGRRIAFGWVPDRNPEPTADTGLWLWGGDLAVPRELDLAGTGELTVRVPGEIGRGPELAYSAEYGSGEWSVAPGRAGSSFDAEASGRFGYCVLRPAQDADQYLVSATVSGAGGAAIFGLAVQTSEQLDRGTAILCYPSERRVCAVDLTAARSEVANEYEKATTEYASVAEGCLPTASFDDITITVIVRGDLVEAFVADRVCLTYRLPVREAGSAALLIQDGSGRFSDVRGHLVGQFE